VRIEPLSQGGGGEDSLTCIGKGGEDRHAGHRVASFLAGHDG
jgi:hypothetical protein